MNQGPREAAVPAELLEPQDRCGHIGVMKLGGG